MKFLGIVLCLALLLAAPLHAQTLWGDVAVAYSNPVSLLKVTGGGSVSTLLGPLAAYKVFTPAVNRTNNGVVACVTHATSGLFTVLEVDASGIGTTLLTGSTPLQDVTAFTVDQHGDYMLLNVGSSSATTGIFRLDAVNALTTVAVNFGMVSPLAMAEDLDSGDLVALDALGRFYRVTRGGGVTVLSTQVMPVNGLAALHSRPAVGGLLGAWGTALHHVQLNPFSVTTMATPAQPFRAMGMDFEPTTRTLVVSSSPVQGSSRLLHFGETGSLLTTLTTRTSPMAGLALMGSRHVFGVGRVAPGMPYTLIFSFPGETGRGYLAAASFGHAPGFKVHGLRIPLNPDPLFFLSQADPKTFSGFQGVLTTSGLGSGVITLPAVGGLKGVRFFVAAVTYDGGGFRRVSEPLGLTVE